MHTHTNTHTHTHTHTPGTHIGESPAGADGVIVAHPTLVFRILSPGQHVLVAAVVGPLVQHPAAALHPDGVAAAEVGVHVGAVCVTLIRAALEVLILVKSDLEQKIKRVCVTCCALPLAAHTRNM